MDFDSGYGWNIFKYFIIVVCFVWVGLYIFDISSGYISYRALKDDTTRTKYWNVLSDEEIEVEVVQEAIAPDSSDINISVLSTGLDLFNVENDSFVIKYDIGDKVKVRALEIISKKTGYNTMLYIVDCPDGKTEYIY